MGLALLCPVGCVDQPQVLAHDLQVDVRCDGEIRTGIFRFPDATFEMKSGFYVPDVPGKQIEGPVLASSIVMMGLPDFGRTAYRMYLEDSEFSPLQKSEDGTIKIDAGSCTVYYFDTSEEYSAIGEWVDCFGLDTVVCQARATFVD